MEFARGSLRKGGVIFVLLSVISFSILFRFTSGKESFVALRQLKPGYLSLALCLVVVDWLLGGGRLWCFIRPLSRGTPYWSGFKANLANIFAGAMTPLQSGGGPAQIFMLRHQGVPIPKALASSLMCFISTSFIILTSALLLFISGISSTIDIRFQGFYRYGAGLFFVISALLIIPVVRPRLVHSLVHALSRLASLIRKKDYTDSKFIHWMLNHVEEYRLSLSLYMRRGKVAIASGVAFSFLIFLNKFSIAWVILKGLGLNPPYFQVILIQILLILVIYFSPSPGATGFAELTSAVFMSGIVPRQLLPVYVALWRLFTLYLSVGMGGIILFKSLREVGNTASSGGTLGAG